MAINPRHTLGIWAWYSVVLLPIFFDITLILLITQMLNFVSEAGMIAISQFPWLLLNHVARINKGV